MFWLELFACAVIVAWSFAISLGGTAERETMCMLTMMWLATIVANIVTREPAPYLWYSFIDIGGVVWLWQHQRRNWQWIPAGLFACMLLTHLVFWLGTKTGSIAYQGRPYQDFLAIFAYLQLAAAGYASYERARLGKRFSWLGSRLMASDLLPRGSLHHAHHARKT